MGPSAASKGAGLGGPFSVINEPVNSTGSHSCGLDCARMRRSEISFHCSDVNMAQLWHAPFGQANKRIELL